MLLLCKGDSLFTLPMVFISEAEGVDTKLEADIKSKQVFEQKRLIQQPRLDSVS